MSADAFRNLGIPRFALPWTTLSVFSNPGTSVRAFLTALALLTITPAAAAQFSEGSILYHPIASFDTLLIDEDGVPQHTWPGTARPGLSVRLMPDGRLLRTRNVAMRGGGSSGAIEILDWDGVVEWSYSVDDAERLSHHDATFLPNGNVVIVCWDKHSGAEAEALGRNPATVNLNWWPLELIEVEPTGPTTGTIVWNWKALDHLVQNFNAGMPNFGAPADNPRRIDLNYANIANSGDWQHANAVDYNIELDQLVVSQRGFSEFWIIDHSTTTAEAATSSGGNSGHGGDLMYRWGNPAAYGRGVVADQKLFTQHDSHWIESGKPGAGNMIVFNNGNARPTGPSSSVEEIVLPAMVGGTYPIGVGVPFAPTSALWTYEDQVNPLSFFTSAMGGVDRLQNGNTMICLAGSGIFREVAPDFSTVHQFQNTTPPVGSVAVFRTRSHTVHPFPTTFCPANANSVGPGTSIGWSGSISVQRNDLVLTVADAPPNEFGLFYYGAGTTSAPLGDGVRCISQPFYRLLPPAQMDGFGNASIVLDMEQPPQAGSDILAGSTWYFQFWHRDDPSFGAGSNLSNGMEITFWN
tara:strand:- start:18803 stop:20539 length:1737 start_codon:yes stop_codon:yes gene_type:complete